MHINVFILAKFQNVYIYSHAHYTITNMKLMKENLLKFAFIVSIISTVGSLFFSEVLKFPPCVLCWYQRIFMYPLVVILAIGLWKKDKNLPFFVLPLSIAGTIVAIYHNLLYYGIIPESIAPCTLGISCSTKQVEWFGFITIPMLSLFSFLTISILMLFYRKQTVDK